MAGRKIRDANDARACLDALARSGMEPTEWTRSQGIDGRSLNTWRINLGRKRPPPDTLHLVELVARTESGPAFRVACGPFVIEVPPAFDADALARLLDVVAAC